MNSLKWEKHIRLAPDDFLNFSPIFAINLGVRLLNRSGHFFGSLTVWKNFLALRVKLQKESAIDNPILHQMGNNCTKFTPRAWQEASALNTSAQESTAGTFFTLQLSSLAARIRKRVRSKFVKIDSWRLFLLLNVGLSILTFEAHARNE